MFTACRPLTSEARTGPDWRLEPAHKVRFEFAAVPIIHTAPPGQGRDYVNM